LFHYLTPDSKLSNRILREKVVLEYQALIPKVREKEEQKNTLLQLPSGAIIT